MNASKATRRIFALVLFALSVFAASGCGLFQDDPADAQLGQTIDETSFTTGGIFSRNPQDTEGDAPDGTDGAVSDIKSVSEVNIDVSRSSDQVQAFAFAIDRETNQVRVVDPQSSLDGIDLMARLTVEILDANALSSATPGKRTVIVMAVHHDEVAVKVTGESIDNPEGLEATIDLQVLNGDPSLQRTSRVQSTGGGLRATLDIEVTGADTNANPSDPSKGPDFTQDKPQQTIELTRLVRSGTVNLNIRAEIENPPLAVLPPVEPPPPEPERPSPSQPNEPDTPKNEPSDEPPPESSGGPSGNSDSENNSEAPPDSNSGGQGSSSPPKPEPPKTELTPTPGGEETIPDPQGSPTPYANNIDVIIVLDTSNGMRFHDPENQRRVAAYSYLFSSLPGDQLGIVHFANGIDLTPLQETSLLATHSRARRVLRENIYTYTGGTGFGLTQGGLGLARACIELIEEGRADNRVAILVTNATITSGAPTALVGAPHACFVDQNWPVYSVGIGNINAALLGRITDDTGGDLRAVDNLNTLICEFQRIRATLAGSSPESCKAFNIESSEIGKALEFTVNVPPGQLQATFSTSWVRGDVVTILTPPSGSAQIFRGTKPSNVDREVSVEDRFEIYSVHNPESGDWKIKLWSKEVIEGSDSVVFGFTTIPSAAR